jgi:hypothetical protein
MVKETFMKKRIGVAAFVALMALGVAAVLQAMPIGSTGYDNFYYSDETFNTQVGERFRDCDDSRFSWGVRTQWVEPYEWDCPTHEMIEDPCPSGMHRCDETNTYDYGYTCSCVG